VSGKRIYNPTVTIGGTEFKCMTRTVELTPGDFTTFCEQDWSCTVEIEVSYGAAGSWNVLNGFRDTLQTVVIKPEDAATSVTNPAATFTARIPAVPFVTGAGRGEKMTMSLELMAEAEPVFATT
jgi:hypothetical protein